MKIKIIDELHSFYFTLLSIYVIQNFIRLC